MLQTRKYPLIPLALAAILLLAIAVAAAAWSRIDRVPAMPDLTMQSSQTNTASLLHFSLEEMTDRADKVFRGTVIDFQPTTVSAGGGELPAVIYYLRVDEAFKGSFESKDGVLVVEIQILGNIKESPADSGLKQLSIIPTPPQLRVGSDYLLLTTPESAIGLSTTVGLGQGSFELFSLDKQEWALNGFKNAGLYDGAVLYEELASDIETLVGE